MIVAVPRATSGAVALDVGCGEQHQRFRVHLAALGYRPIGIDISGEAPDALADAHRLPVQNESVDAVLTSAVFEHLKHPHIAMSEIARVLVPGGIFIGSIAFGEPFHISYFHHSPLAVFDLLDSSNLEVDAVVISDGYSAFYAHFEMGYAGAHMPRALQQFSAEFVRVLALMPARVRAILSNRPDHYQTARLAFARSHTAAVGVVAHRGA